MPTIVQTAPAYGSLSSLTSHSRAFTAPVGAGRTLVLIGSTATGESTPPAVADTLGNAWESVYNSAATSDYRIFAALVRSSAAGACTVTVTGSGGGILWASFGLYELDNAGALRNVTGRNQGPVTAASPGLGTSRAGVLLLAGMTTPNWPTTAATPPAGWTADYAISLDNETALALSVVSYTTPATGSYDPVWTLPAGSAAATVVLTFGPGIGPGIQLRGLNATASGAGTTSVTVSRPSWLTDGDLMILGVSHKGTDWAVAPAGWTLIARDLQDVLRVEAYWKRASSEPASWTITGTATVATAVLTSFQGALATGTPIATYSIGKAAAGVVNFAPSLLITDKRVLLGAIVGQVTASAHVTADTQVSTTSSRAVDEEARRFYPRVQRATTTGGNCACTWTDVQKVAPGETGVLKSTQNGTSGLAGASVAIFLAVLPEPTSSRAGTRYYMGTARPQVESVTRSPGTWHVVEGAHLAGVDSTGITELSQYAAGNGSSYFLRFFSNEPNTSALLWRACTPPLAAQTISGTVDVVQLVHQQMSERTGTSSRQVWARLHVYVSQGDDLGAVRGVLLNNYVDSRLWPYYTSYWQSLDAPAVLTPVTAQAGDRIVVEWGAQLGTFPTPTPLRPPQDYMILSFLTGTQSKDNHFSSAYCSGVAWQDGLPNVGDFDTARAPYVHFSAAIDELPNPDPVVTNTTCATALVLPSVLPYLQEVPYGTRGSQAPQCPVWYAWTAPTSGVVFITSAGSQYGVQLDVYDDCALSFADGYIGSNDAHCGNWYTVAVETVEVVAGTTYYIRATQGVFLSGGQAYSQGGPLRIQIRPYQPITDGDVFVPYVNGPIVRYNTAGELCDIDLGWTFMGPNSVAIDYTKRPMPDWPLSDEAETLVLHTDERLAVAGFFYSGLIEYTQVDPLYTSYEINYNSDSWPTTSSDNWADGDQHRTAQIRITPTGKLITSWFGNGFTRVAGIGNRPSVTLDPATTNSANLTEADAIWQDGYDPWEVPPCVRYPADPGATGGWAIAVSPADERLITYTTGPVYRPVAASSYTIRRYHLDTGQQPDLVTLAATPGSTVGGLRGIAVLSNGEILVANGSAIQRLSAAGAVLQAYTGTDPALSSDFSAVRPLQREDAFWAADLLSGTVYLFDLASGDIRVAVNEHLGTGNLTDLCVYFGVVPPEPEIPICVNGTFAVDTLSGTRRRRGRP